MLRAMDSAVAGLRAHQNKMDVIGHNIANVNTYGFKAQTYTFKEAMYQSSTVSTSGNATQGGVNAAQYGYGTLMGTIGVDMAASTPTYVGGLNASINGEGFFLTSTKPTDLAGVEFEKSAHDWQYTRVGQFKIDSQGFLVDGNGNFVYGYSPESIDKDGKLVANAKVLPLRITGDIKANPNGSGQIVDYSATGDALKATNVSINAAGEITATITKENTTTNQTEDHPGVSLGRVAIVTFQNPEGLTKAGGSYYTSVDSDNTGRADAGIPGGDNALMGGYVEASNVDLAKEFADMITTHRGFQSNSKMITVSDEMLSDLVAMKR
ncbi:MAG: flagellar hook-basal body complex protein [Lachnospiraceae bacterium]|nr:flagellar hook-basal body complex protein [Lachnospiraceae bacterium]